MYEKHDTCRSTPRRRAWTLVEILVAATILLILTSGLIVSSRVVGNSRRVGAARAQMRILSTAIDQYASFWPAWKVGSVIVAEKGWPDFVPGRNFATCLSTFGLYKDADLFGPFFPIGSVGFNTFVNLPGPSWIDPADDLRKVLLLNSNTTLSFALTAGSGSGPIIKDRSGANLANARDFLTSARDIYDLQDPLPRDEILYPGFCVGTSAAKRAELVIDPWGTPLRYFWVYRDASRTAHRGYLPVDFAPLAADNSPVGVFNIAFNQPAEPAATQVAAGFVLESAGPDGKLGNVWKINPTEQEISDAADNLVISP